MLKNMRSRNSSGAFCRKHIFPTRELLESPEVLSRRIYFSRKENQPELSF
jgi:hypothetical protein